MDPRLRGDDDMGKERPVWLISHIAGTVGPVLFHEPFDEAGEFQTV